MEIKVIRNSTEYRKMLQEAERLVALDPTTGSAEADRLELLSLLIEDYERRTFPFDAPDPIDAIEFRMQEQGLRQVDLVPLLGSRSRASEVLGRKRPLTVQMIRAVSTGLGIPLDVLIAGKPISASRIKENPAFSWDKFPLREMEKRGWINIPTRSADVEKSAAESVKIFLQSLGENRKESALFRRTFRGDALEEKAFYSTLAWTGRVIARAKETGDAYPTFKPAALTENFFRDVAQLSRLEDGPVKAVRLLADKGIALIVEPRLPNTLLDGAALMTEGGLPVIALTLRYDRADYFWFTLLHELAHVWKHLSNADEGFIDRIENTSPSQLVEKEANRIARDALIPRSVWKRSTAYLHQSRSAILELSDELNIHPGIVVGRIQKETEKYELFRDLLGQGTIRPLFPDVAFS
jgi:HTH-type transcriptional regulator/antitoxin HigA